MSPFLPIASSGRRDVKVDESVSVPAPPDVVWRTVGNMSDLGRWIPGIAGVALHGDVRRITFTDGTIHEERILSCSDETRTCTYAYVSGPLPLERHEARLAVTADGGGSRVRWTADFACSSTAEDDRLRGFISRAYRRALERLVVLHQTGPAPD